MEFERPLVELEEKLADLDRRIHELVTFRDALTTYMGQVAGQDPRRGGERAERAEPGGRERQQKQRDRDFGDRQRDRERFRELVGHAEVLDRLLRAREIEQFPDAGDGKNRAKTDSD